MADDKHIRIRIETAGGEQAAQEVRKPAAAMEESAKAADALADSTRELTEAEADRARRKAEYEARMEARRAAGTDVAMPPAEVPNPMTDGSMLRAETARREAEEAAAAAKIEALEKEEALRRRVADEIRASGDAMRETAAANDDFVESLERANDAAKQPDGFQQLFSQQRLIQIGRELGGLGQEVRKFWGEFSKTEAGREALAGLSDETKLLGSTAADVVGSMAKGLAAGGPVGAGIAGLTALVRNFAGDWLESNRRIEEANRELEQAESAAAVRRIERQKAASNDALQRQIREENDRLEDQNEILRENERLHRTRKELADSEFDLKQAEERAAGKSEEDLERDRIARNLQQQEEELTRRRRQRQEETNLLERAVNNALVDTRNVAAVNSTTSPEYKAAYEKWRAAKEKFDDAVREDMAIFEGLDNERQTARNRASAATTRVNDRQTRRETEEKKREEEKATRDRERKEEEEARRQDRLAAERDRIGQQGEGYADRAAKMVSGISDRAAKMLEGIGNQIGDDPTIKEMEALSRVLGQAVPALEQRDANRAREMRALKEDVARLTAALQKNLDGK